MNNKFTAMFGSLAAFSALLIVAGYPVYSGSYRPLAPISLFLCINSLLFNTALTVVLLFADSLEVNPRTGAGIVILSIGPILTFASLATWVGIEFAPIGWYTIITALVLMLTTALFIWSALPKSDTPTSDDEEANPEQEETDIDRSDPTAQAQNE